MRHALLFFHTFSAVTVHIMNAQSDNFVLHFVKMQTLAGNEDALEAMCQRLTAEFDQSNMVPLRTLKGLVFFSFDEAQQFARRLKTCLSHHKHSFSYI